MPEPRSSNRETAGHMDKRICDSDLNPCKPLEPAACPAMAYASLALANVSVTAKGAKMAMLTNGVDRCNYTFAAPTSCPFGPSNF